MLKSVKCELYKGFSQLKMLVFLIVMALAPIVGAVGSILLSKSNEIISNPSFGEALRVTNLDLPIKMLNGLVDFIVPVFIIILVADSITEEYIHGTLKLSLMVPMTRVKCIVSKLIALGVEIAVMLGVLLIFSYIAGFIFFGNTDVFRIWYFKSIQ